MISVFVYWFAVAVLKYGGIRKRVREGEVVFVPFVLEFGIIEQLDS